MGIGDWAPILKLIFLLAIDYLIVLCLERLLRRKLWYPKINQMEIPILGGDREIFKAEQRSHNIVGFSTNILT